MASAPALRYPGSVIPVPSLYRQDSDFLYLTGVTQPDCVAVLRKEASGEVHYTLLTPPPDLTDRTWHGARIDADAARRVFGAHEGGHTSALPALLQDAVHLASGGGGGVLLCDLPAQHAPSTPLHDMLRSAVAKLGSASAQRQSAWNAAAAGGAVSSLKTLLAPLRWRKSPAELTLMRASATATAHALSEAAACAVPGAREGVPAAAFEWHVRGRAGAQRLAFPSVCASGARACAIHYGRHDGRIEPNDQLLMDAGCEFHGYVSDVTRTWPVSGAFTDAQRRVYDAVRAVHAAALAAVRPGVTIAQLHAQSVQATSEHIADLGMLPDAGSASTIAKGHYFRLYPHALSHYLGLDTHDTPSVSLTRPLEPGVVLTIEPGLYCWPDTPGLAPRYSGIGVRMEDMVAVTEDGYEVLSSHKLAPVDADEVTRWAQEARDRASASMRS